MIHIVYEHYKNMHDIDLLLHNKDFSKHYKIFLLRN